MSTSREQIARLLALVPYLQGKGAVSVADVAREFRVPEKVIRRDVSVLIMCGLPGLLPGDLIDVDFDALEDEQVIRLSNADYLARPLRLDSNEAAALVVALRALRDTCGPDEREVVARTLAKVERAAGEGGRPAAHVEVQVDESTALLQSRLARAVDDARQVRLSYASPTRDEVTERVVDPLAVLAAGGHHYLDAWCHRAEDRRLFRLDRVMEADVLDTPTDEHPELEPTDLSHGIFHPSETDPVATLRVSARGRWVAEYVPVEEVVEEPDGGLTVRLRYGDPAWVVRLMLRLGGEGRVVAPSSLAVAVEDVAQRTLALYRGSAPPTT